MVSLQSRPGLIAAVPKRLKKQFKRLRAPIATSLDYAISSVLSFLGCLFAAEVAVGRRVTRRDPGLERRRQDPVARREQFLQSPAALLLPALDLMSAASRVEFFGQPPVKCPVNGDRAPAHRPGKRAYGHFRCIHFPRCKHRDAGSRLSHGTIQKPLKPSKPRPHQRRPRSS